MDDVTALRDALLRARYELSAILYPYTSKMPDDVHRQYCSALDALIAAVEAGHREWAERILAALDEPRP